MTEKISSSAVQTQEAEPAVASAKKPPLKKEKRGWLALSIAVVTLLLLLAAVSLAYYFYKENKQLNNRQQLDISRLNEQFTALQSSQQRAMQQAQTLQINLKTELQQVDRQLRQVKNSSKIYQSDMQTLQRRFAESQVRYPNDWILAEVEYLLKLAGRKIWLERDTAGAVALLAAAEQRLVELSDASLSPLRAALLDDIGILEALPEQDPDGIVLALSALERRIGKLLLSTAGEADAQSEGTPRLSADINEWRNNLSKSWSDFVAGFIVINKREAQLQPLLSPEQRWYLQENLRHTLARAEFAVFRRQQELYNMALHKAEDLLKNYFDLNDNATGHFYNSLQRLSKRKVTVNYPDQLKSAPLLERIIKQRVKKTLAGSHAEQG